MSTGPHRRTSEASRGGEVTGRAPSLRVDSLVVAARDTGVCRMGEPGVCYEVYTIGGRPG